MEGEKLNTKFILAISVCMVLFLNACSNDVENVRQNYKKELAENEIESIDINNCKEETNGIDSYFGTYKIVEFKPDITSWSRESNETIPQEEIDLLIGQKIILSESKFTSFVNFRYHGSPKPESDYSIQKFSVINPEYELKTGSIMDIRAYTCLSIADMEEILLYPYQRIQVKTCISLKDNKILELPFNSESTGNDIMIPTLYVMNDRQLLWELGRTGACFILEKISNEVIEDTEISNNHIFPSGVEGTYEIVEFYPTIYWENRKVGVSRCMSEDDVEEMKGKRIILKKDRYQGYIFNSAPYFWEEHQDDPKIIETMSDTPEYNISTVKRSELYGLKDPIVPEQYLQEIYQEIQPVGSSLDVETDMDYGSGAKYYVLDEESDKLLMMYMKEFFLLERCE